MQSRHVGKFRIVVNRSPIHSVYRAPFAIDLARALILCAFWNQITLHVMQSILGISPRGIIPDSLSIYLCNLRVIHYVSQMIDVH